MFCSCFVLVVLFSPCFDSVPLVFVLILILVVVVVVVVVELKQIQLNVVNCICICICIILLLLLLLLLLAMYQYYPSRSDFVFLRSRRHTFVISSIHGNNTMKQSINQNNQ